MAMNVDESLALRRLMTVAERLSHFARIWVEDLVDFVPETWVESWHRTMGPHSPFVVTVDELQRCEEVGSSEGPLTPDTIRDRTQRCLLILRVDDSKVMRRTLSLPPAVVARLDEALDLNLNTWTPFAPGDVYAAARPVEQSRFTTGTATAIELRCVPRPLVDARIAALNALSLDPDAIELGDGRFMLHRPTRKRRGAQRHRWLLASLVLLLLVQFTGAYAALTYRQQTEIETLEADRAAMLKALRRQADAEKDARARRSGLLKLFNRIDENFSVSRALQVLAAALPEEALLREFELGRDRAEGHVAILGTPGLDISTILAKTGFYNLSDLSVLSANEADRKVFSARFIVSPWIQANEGVAR